MRYVQKRVNASGSERWYWRRPGHPVRRLPDSAAARAAMVKSLNASADAERAAEGHQEGTVAWAVDKYRASPKFTGRALATRRAYEPYMRSLTDTIGGYLLAELTRGAVREIVDGVEGAARKHHCAAVLSRVVSIGRDYGYIAHNLTDKLELPSTGRREAVWTAEEEARLFGACAADARADAARLGFLLLFYTGQRVSDVRAMTWAHFDGDRISVVQQKTGARRKIKCHRVLRAALEAAYPARKGLPIVAQPNGLAYSKPGWESVYRRVRNVAKVQHLQMRDIRRTAAVRLAEAGCELHEIASVTGHSLTDLKVLFEVYLPKTTAMAESAITKLERRTDSE
jgi:integrase